MTCAKYTIPVVAVNSCFIETQKMFSGERERILPPAANQAGGRTCRPPEIGFMDRVVQVREENHTGSQ